MQSRHHLQPFNKPNSPKNARGINIEKINYFKNNSIKTAKIGRFTPVSPILPLTFS